MRIIFCDDDERILEELQNYVREFFSSLGNSMPEFAAYTSGVELLKNESRADLAFLDVEMPGIKGIDVGAKLKKINPGIKIFIVTSYPDYLDDAMRFHVFRYLSKPIDKKRLFRNLKEAVYQYNIESHEYTIVTADEVLTRRSEEIVCVEAFQRKVFIYTLDGVYKSTESIEYWKNTLTLPCFFSPHRSYIVNMQYIYTIGKDSVTLKYRNKEKEAYVTKRKYTEFKNNYLMYLECVQ
ncbi:MAG: LytR/AlgR family response regulator transcription factor [Candidatus Limivicinus sp.]